MHVRTEMSHYVHTLCIENEMHNLLPIDPPGPLTDIIDAVYSNCRVDTRDVFSAVVESFYQQQHTSIALGLLQYTPALALPTKVKILVAFRAHISSRLSPPSLFSFSLVTIVNNYQRLLAIQEWTLSTETSKRPKLPQAQSGSPNNTFQIAHQETHNTYQMEPLEGTSRGGGLPPQRPRAPPLPSSAKKWQSRERIHSETLKDTLPSSAG